MDKHSKKHIAADPCFKIEKLALNNTNYRKIISTNQFLQVVLMHLQPGQDIPRETHKGDQIIHIVSGRAVVEISKTRKLAKAGDMIIIPSGKSHYVKNSGKQDLKIYTVYSPPEHY